MDNRSEIYYRAQNACQNICDDDDEDENFILFKQIIDENITDNELMFMLFLEIGNSMLQYDECYNYMIDAFAQKLTESQLIICTIRYLGSLNKIYKKNTRYDKSKSMTYLKNLYKMINPIKYEELQRSLLSHRLKFSGIDEEFELIKNWEQIVEDLENEKKHFIEKNPPKENKYWLDILDFTRKNLNEFKLSCAEYPEKFNMICELIDGTDKLMKLMN